MKTLCTEGREGTFYYYVAFCDLERRLLLSDPLSLFTPLDKLALV